MKKLFLIALTLIATLPLSAQQRRFAVAEIFNTGDSIVIYKNLVTEYVFVTDGMVTKIKTPPDTARIYSSSDGSIYEGITTWKKVIIPPLPLTIPATSFAQQSGVVVTSGILGGVDKGDWVMYKLTMPGLRTAIEYTYAMSDATTGSVEFRLGSQTAVPFAKSVLPVTGGWGTYSTITIPLNPNVAFPNEEVTIYVTFAESIRTTGSGGNILKFVYK